MSDQLNHANELRWTKRRATMLKMFMLSLVSMGIIIGVLSADLLSPVMGTLWCVFVLTAFVFMSLAKRESRSTSPIQRPHDSD